MQITHTYALGSRAKFRLPLSGGDVEVKICRICLDNEVDVIYVVHQRSDKHRPKRKWTALPSDLTPTPDSRFARITMVEEVCSKPPDQ
jgi:hypothetical protein